MKLLKLATLAALGLLGSGCATLFTGAVKTVAITSHPEGAEVLVDGQTRGFTPMALQYSGMTKDVRMTLRKPGYRDHHFAATRNLETTAILNCGSVICWGVDILNGAMWRFDPTEIMVNLQPDGSQLAPGVPPPPPPPSAFEPPPAPPPR